MKRAPTVCLDCPQIAPSGSLCDDCRRSRRRAVDQRRPGARARGYTTAWERLARAYIKAHPTCEQHDCDAPAVDVHHVDGLGPDGPRGRDWKNLRALCHAHHSERTARDQPGGWNRS